MTAKDLLPFVLILIMLILWLWKVSDLGADAIMALEAAPALAFVIWFGAIPFGMILASEILIHLGIAWTS